MAYRYQHYMNLSENELHNRLLQRKLPAMLIEEIKATVREQKQHRRSVQAKTRAVEALWADLLSPLSYEIRTLASMQRYKKDTYYVKERVSAITAYLALLRKLQVLIKKWRMGKELLTPTELAKELKLDAAGTHWVDWVATHKKNEILALFAAVPRTFKAKTKTPFERKISKVDNAKLRAKLKRRTEKDLTMARAEADIAYTEEAAAHIARIEKALERIDRMEETEPVPLTWHGFYKFEKEKS